MTAARTLNPKQLRDKRKRMGLALDDICVAFGCPGNASEVSRWEQGKRLSLPHGKTADDYQRVLDWAAERMSAERAAAK